MSHAAENKPAPVDGRERRRRYLGATIITCVVLLMVGGTLHVVSIGATRLEDMRRLAS